MVSAEANNSSNTKKTSSNSDSVVPPTPDESDVSPPAKLQVKSTKVTQIKMEVKVTKNVNNSVPEKVSMVSTTTTVSSSSTMECTPVIGAIPKAVGDSARDRIREMLVEALAKVWKEAAHDDRSSDHNCKITLNFL